MTLSADSTLAARFTLDNPPDGRIVAATLPGARSSYVGGPPMTAFLSVVSRASTPAQSCRILPPVGAPIVLSYRLLNGATPTGSENPQFDIRAGYAQSFLLAMSPIAQTNARGYTYLPRITCENADLAPIEGVSSIQVSIGAAPVPDILSIGATPSGDGVVFIPPNSNRIGFMAASAVNIGAGDGSAGAGQATVSVEVDTGAVVLPVTLEVCESGPAGCLTPRGETRLETIFDPNIAKTFTVFVRADGAEPVAFSPANARVFLRFTDGNGVLRSVTSAAISAPAPSGPPDSAHSLSSRWSVLVRQADGEWPSLRRGSLFVDDSGRAILADGDRVRMLSLAPGAAQTEWLTQGKFGLGGRVNNAGEIVLDMSPVDAPDMFWGVRDERGLSSNWAHPSHPFDGIHITRSGEIRGQLAGCSVSGSTSNSGFSSIILYGCPAAGPYLATLDEPANDTLAPALVIAGTSNGWRLTQ